MKAKIEEKESKKKKMQENARKRTKNCEKKKNLPLDNYLRGVQLLGCLGRFTSHKCALLSDILRAPPSLAA